MSEKLDLQKLGLSSDPVQSLQNIADTEPAELQGKELETIHSVVDGVGTEGGEVALNDLHAYLTAAVAEIDSQEPEASTASADSPAALRQLADRTAENQRRLKTIFDNAINYTEEKLHGMTA